MAKEYFRNFFLRLNGLSCQTLGTLAYIPIDALFNTHSNLYDSDESRKCLELFSIYADVDDEKEYKQETETFYQKFLQYKKDKGNNGMRKIGKFEFKYNIWDDPSPNITQSLKDFFLAICGLSKSIIVLCDISKLDIYNKDDFSAIFHSDLKCFGFENGEFGFDVKNVDIDSIGTIARLEEIAIYPAAFGMQERVAIRNT